MALGAHLLSPLPPSKLRFTGIQSYSYMEQRKVETDVDRMTGIELVSLQLNRPRTNRQSYVCFCRGRKNDVLLETWRLDRLVPHRGK